MKTLGAVLLLVTAALARKSYLGYQLFELYPTSAEQSDLVNDLYDDIELDVWSESRIVGHASRVLVPPHRVGPLAALLEVNAIPFAITDHNVQSSIDEELIRLTGKSQKSFDLNDFNTYEDIEDEVREMAARCPPDLTCDVTVLGQSTEGYDISMLTIRGPGNPNKQAIWIDSTIHAREWLAPATVLRIMDAMTRDYNNDDNVRDLIAGFDWYFVAVMNPDGYIFSWTDDRLWRKSRNVNEGSSCIGTDLNRNYNASWMVTGASSNPCSQTYAGSSAASEVETQIVEDKLRELGDDVIALLTVHTAATMWLIPWGHTEDGQCVIADDHDEMMRVLDATVDAIQATHNDRAWRRGNSCVTIYPTSGSSQDFAKLSGIKYSITPELRGPGFVVDPSAIDVSFTETWNGILAMVDAIQNP